MHPARIISAGKTPDLSGKAIVLLHGRGASADNILSLAPRLHLEDYTILAPEAQNNTWYPYSFLVPVEKNEPWLTYALNMIDTMIQDLKKEGIGPESIYILGFSQGACLALEYAARNTRKYGGIIAFTGGLIGEVINYDKFLGDLENTPVFIGSDSDDPHVPPDRILETSDVLNKLNARLTLKIYENMGHTINEDEINTVNKLILNQ